MAPLGGCFMQPNPGIADWADTASLVVAYPAAIPPEATGLRAQQQAAAGYLFDLGLLSQRFGIVGTDAPFDILAATAGASDPLAGAAITELGAAVAKARAGNPRPAPRQTGPQMPDTPEDWRLEALVRAGDAPLRQLLGQLDLGLAALPPAPEGLLAAARDGYRPLVGQIAATHALLRDRSRHLDQEAVRRRLRAEATELRRAFARLPTATPPAAARG
jgi:hypothetical protein